MGNLTASTDRRGQITDFDFDARNRVVRQRDPLVSGQPSRGATLFAYDDAGHRTSVTDPTGALSAASHDDLGRLRTSTAVVRQDAPAGSFTTTFDYDDLGRQTFAQDPAGAVTTQAHNPASELLSVTDPLGKATTFAYDVAGRRTAEQDALGRRTEHVYDLAGRETATVYKEPGSGTVLATEYRTFDPAGNQEAFRSARSASASDGTYRTTSSFDALNRLIELVEPDAAAPIVTSYGYDAAGTHGYSYDRSGRLDTWTAPGGALTDYDYDPAGNRTAGAVTSSFDARNRLVTEGATTYTWSARGTLATVDDGTATTTASFDALGRQTAWGPTTYAYDDLDRIAARGATNFSYAGVELDPVAAGGERYARTPAAELLALEANGASRIVGENRHGDLSWLLDATGTVTDTRIWDPYGQSAGTTGTTGPSVGYQGD